MFFIFFFFCKQKTAYEMRISDWSSDVCSSDLFVLRIVLRLMSASIRRKARARGVDYSFFFMRANGDQLRQIAALIESGAIKPVVDKVFPFEATNEALDYIETGRSRGKAVVKLR